MKRNGKLLLAALISAMMVAIFVPCVSMAATIGNAAQDGENVAVGNDLSTAYIGGIEDQFYKNGAEVTQDQTTDGLLEGINVILNDQKLVQNEDFTVSYENNINITTADNPAYIVFTGTGDYTGEQKVPFQITKMGQFLDPVFSSKTVFVNKTITLKVTNYGEAQGANIGTISVKTNGCLAAKEVGVSGNTTIFELTGLKKGKGTVRITASGDDMYYGASFVYGVTVKQTYPIKKSCVSLSKTSYTYNGYYKKPTVKVKVNGKTLKKGTSYTVSYSNNKNAGTAKVTVKAIGNTYTGTVTKTFKIKKASQKISVKVSNYTLGINKTATITQYAKRGNVNVGTFTYCSYKSSVITTYRNPRTHNCVLTSHAAGTARVRIHAAATKNYKAANKDITFTVKGASTTLTKDMITLSPTKFKYNGKRQYPVVTVKANGKKLTYGTDYKYWITNEIGPGYANVKVWGVGKYKGTVNVQYYIYK